VDEADLEGQRKTSGGWKPQLHFVWDTILDLYFTEEIPAPSLGSTFQDFFRIVVDGE
jgi:DNA polymerase phi